MKNLFLLLSAVLFLTGLFSACSAPASSEEKPPNMVDKETLVSIMADMQIAEAKVKNLRVSTDSSRKVYSIYEHQIFERWNTSPEDFAATHAYYLGSFNEMRVLHTALTDTLTRRQKQETEKQALLQKQRAEQEKLTKEQSAARKKLKDQQREQNLEKSERQLATEELEAEQEKAQKALERKQRRAQKELDEKQKQSLEEQQQREKERLEALEDE